MGHEPRERGCKRRLRCSPERCANAPTSSCYGVLPVKRTVAKQRAGSQGCRFWPWGPESAWRELPRADCAAARRSEQNTICTPTTAAFDTCPESRGPAAHLDLRGLALVGPGLVGIAYGAVRGQALGWTSTTILASFAFGIGFVIAFVAWELRAADPMLPMRFFRSRQFAATNGLSFAMFFGVFGVIFLLAQFFQTVHGYSPVQAGLRTLPWTAMPMIVAPIAGTLSDRVGSRPLMFVGLVLQTIAIAWLAAVFTPEIAYSSLIVPFILAGAGMALVSAPAANAALGSVRPAEAGQASGATNAIRELGGVFGVAVLASVFSAHGSYASPHAYTAGLTSALPVGAAILAVGALVALLVPGIPCRQDPRAEPRRRGRRDFRGMKLRPRGVPEVPARAAKRPPDRGAPSALIQRGRCLRPQRGLSTRIRPPLVVPVTNTRKRKTRCQPSTKASCRPGSVSRCPMELSSERSFSCDFGTVSAVSHADLHVSIRRFVERRSEPASTRAFAPMQSVWALHLALGSLRSQPSPHGWPRRPGRPSTSGLSQSASAHFAETNLGIPSSAG